MNAYNNAYNSYSNNYNNSNQNWGVHRSGSRRNSLKGYAAPPPPPPPMPSSNYYRNNPNQQQRNYQQRSSYPPSDPVRELQNMARNEGDVGTVASYLGKFSTHLLFRALKIHHLTSRPCCVRQIIQGEPRAAPTTSTIVADRTVVSSTPSRRPNSTERL